MRSGLRILTIVCLTLATGYCAGQQTQTNVRVLEMKRAIKLQIQQATPAAKAEIEKVPSVPAPTPASSGAGTTSVPQPTPVRAVGADQKNLLMTKIVDFANHARSEERKFSAIATVAIIGIAALSFVASVLSFASRNKAGGVLGLVVVAVVGITNAYPVSALSDFYRSLAAQTAALQMECDLKDPFTAEAFNSAADQLKVLILYEADKRPQLGSPGATADELTQTLQALKTGDSH